MFQYATGRSLSLQNGTELLLDTSWYEYHSLREYELDIFNISARPLEGWLRFFYSQLRRRRYAFLRTPLEALQVPFAPKHIVDREDGFDDRLATAGRNIYLDGFWQSERYFIDIRDVLLRDFTFKGAPDPVNSATLAEISKSNAVCLHIRRGDYVTTEIGQSKHGFCGLDYYRAAIDYMQSRVSNPTFFIFSDDPQWVESNFPDFAQMTAVTHNVGRKNSEEFFV